ncbi:MAG: hypothetical protein LWX83_02520 [Anaerolineae bacterium]|nr:hypothetical protein [Anaerolineae bacterium]
MENLYKEKILYTDSEIKLGEVRERLFGLISPGVIMNQKTHSLVLTDKRLVFVPDDANAKLKLMLARGSITLAKYFSGGQMSNTATKMFLANEGIDIFGERSVSLKYLPSGEDYIYVEGSTVGLTVIRRKDDTHENDFLSLPSTLLLLGFLDHDHALKFFDLFRQTRQSWSDL